MKIRFLIAIIGTFFVHSPVVSSQMLDITQLEALQNLKDEKTVVDEPIDTKENKDSY